MTTTGQFKEADSSFPIKRVERPEGSGRTVEVYHIVCSAEGCTQHAEVTIKDRRLPATMLTKKYINMGWGVGKSADRHLCPEHAHPRSKAKHEAEKAPPPNAIAAPTANTNKALGIPLDARRAILKAIEAVYIDSEAGYQFGHSDDTVAQQVKDVPVEWVAALRSENFGPPGDGVDIMKALAQVSEIEERARALVKQVDDKIEALMIESEGAKTTLLADINDLRRSVLAEKDARGK